MRPTNAMIGKEITIINRPPWHVFKRISGIFTGREAGIIIIETPYKTKQSFRLDEWKIESVKYL